MVKTKKEVILDTALSLFADKGYDATPTSLIAREAGVSEGLIFKHYQNKENLLEAVVKAGYRRITDKSKGLVVEDDPAKLICNILDMPQKLVEDERNFWRMQFRLVDEEISQKHHIRFSHSVMQKLVEAFKKLGYKEPELESEVIMLMVEGLWRQFLHDPDQAHFTKMLDLIKSKYKGEAA
ncbi:TetR/AcrR family transcriptional regulator [Pontibacter akesuensis]|uniref:Transcriptional regulator, TetR family n=1 Tax=Pontibacter akesuensis TaxID=388950 RepID=A0A1I7K543_9BACT|nr:TetR/AcrR family transcriptional regulator [Pontibacter akesuensis]GHA75024.1 TetR family transcriptional regulator [Pontibacter akesuensis]SFU92499.1 transcriptional regulator, TetR family [Pontibacter akesuensis]